MGQERQPITCKVTGELCAYYLACKSMSNVIDQGDLEFSKIPDIVYKTAPAEYKEIIEIIESERCSIAAINGLSKIAHNAEFDPRARRTAQLIIDDIEFIQAI